MKRTIRLITAMILAAVLVCPTIMQPAVAAGRSEQTERPAGQTEKTQINYYQYTTQTADIAPGAAEIPLTPAAVIEAEKAEQKEAQGTEGWSVSAGGSITYEVQIPKDGKYQLLLSYLTESGRSADLICVVRIDGEIPFAEAATCTLKRSYANKTEILQDKKGNDLIPKMEERFLWRQQALLDTTGYQSDPFLFVLTGGRHTLTLTLPEDNATLGTLLLMPREALKPYAEIKDDYMQAGLKEIQSAPLQIEAETPSMQSDTILSPTYDRTSAAASPSDPAKIRRNTIGQTQWADNGMQITYTLDVAEAGLYELSVKYRQNYLLGTAVFRNIYVNGVLPCAECENVRFAFGFDWQRLTIADKAGSPIRIPLQKGKNTLTFSVTLGPWSAVLQGVDGISTEMNDLYRRIIMVTGSDPDPYRDYFLTREISGLAETCQALSDRLARLAEEFDSINGQESNQSAPLKRAAELLADFAAKPADIQDRLTGFREQIASLSSWLLTNKQQPLELDYFTLHADGAALPAVNGGFFENLSFSVQQFFAAFSEDYDSMSDNDGSTAISLWVNDGRNQTQLLKDLIYDRFSEENGIAVSVNLVQGGLIEATLSGNGPDVAVGVARGQPVNLACRGALADLSQMPDFSAVRERFVSDAFVPYTYQDKIYALPMTQNFLVMFYRTDILEELQLDVPNTWEELLSTSAVLQRNNMAVGLPYTAITAAGAVDLGVGAKDLFPTLLLQNGGSYYNDDLTSTALESQASLGAFDLWTAFYTRYGFALSYDFNTRFRTGEMPIAIAAYPMYGILSAAAPEIRGHWVMTAVPGVVQADGSIDRSGGASGSAVVMFEKAKNKEACWKLMSFLTSAELQSSYGNELEALLGASARLATANKEAFEQLGWTTAEKQVLKAQWDWVREIPELPGSYYTSRCIDNAFRAVVYDRATPRTALERENRNINREIDRKRTELNQNKG